MVRREALDQVFAKAGGGPLAEACGDGGFDAVADGDDHVEVVVTDRPPDRPRALLVNVLNVEVYVLLGCLIEHGHEVLRQPDGFALQQHPDITAAFLQLIKDDLALGADGHGIFAHSVTSASMSAISPSIRLRSVSISSSGRGGVYW